MKIRLETKDIHDNYGANILKARGIEDIEKFIHPTIDNLQTWEDLININVGVGIIAELKDDNLVALIVDSDVDGYTSAAIIYQYLSRLKPNITIDIYLHSGKQHGLEDHWEDLQDKPYDLIIVPDAGTNDTKYADIIQRSILVIDHHLLEDENISPYLVIINNQMSPAYKNKNLSGAGMVYQFCRALDNKFGLNWADDYIDLAALGIDADMMSALEYENQYLWYEGFNHIKNFFFEVMVEKQSYSLGSIVTPIGVAFYIVPYINAMIRVGTAEEKERLFWALADGRRLVESNKRGAKGEQTFVAVEAARECTNAKSHQDKIKEKIADSLEVKIHKEGLLDNKILFIRLDENDNFPSELNGLVCMQLSAKYNRPTIVARLNDEGFVRGSARGLSKSELISFKQFLSDSGMFEYTAGHDNAFGISIYNNNLKDFHDYANAALKDVDFESNVYDVCFIRKGVDKDIEDIIFDLSNYDRVWGQLNPQPLFYIENIFINANDIQIMGKNKDTFKFEKNGITYIKFHAKSLIEKLPLYNDIKINIIGKPTINEWRGMTLPQIIIEDIEFSDGELEF